jgi:ABC-2 type transport system permease protein
VTAAAPIPVTVARARRSRLRENLIGFNTIVDREMTRVLRIWVQTLVPPAITMTLYFIIFGSLIGRRVGQVGGFDYMAYIAPGLIMMQVLTNAYTNVVSSFYGAKFGRHIEELLVSPLPSGYIIMGYVTGGVLRGLLVGGLVTVIALFFTDLRLVHPLVTFSTVLLTAIVFSLGGLINAVYSKKFDDVTIIPTFILTPLTYLGGVFYSIQMLPEPWQTISKANPILYMVNAFRYGILGQSDINIYTAYSIILLFMVALYAFSYYLLERGVGMRT